jgi:hypothetical protein
MPSGPPLGSTHPYFFLPPPGVDEPTVMRTTFPGLEVFPAPSTATSV